MSGGSSAGGNNSSGGPVWGGLAPIPVVLLVHDRTAYLQRTLHALSRVEGIEDVLLIVR